MPKAKQKSRRRDDPSPSEDSSSEEVSVTSGSSDESGSTSGVESPPANRAMKAKDKGDAGHPRGTKRAVSDATDDDSSPAASSDKDDLHDLVGGAIPGASDAPDPNGFEAMLNQLAQDLEGPVETGE